MQNTNILKILFLSFCISTALFLDAKEISNTVHNKNLSEISVSAIKKSSDNEDLAKSLTEISRFDTERLNISNAKSASLLSPNFFMPDYGSRITSTIYVRGIGARIDQPSVGMNVDNIPILNKDNYDFDMIDIAGMEFIKGPQSSLFGRNTMAGLINIQTLSPLTYEGSRFIVEYGKKNTMRAGASHYHMINDKFGIGGNVSYSHTDGFFKNEFTDEDCGQEDAVRASLKLSWKPNENLVIENAANYTWGEQNGYAYEFVKTGRIAYNDPCFYRRSSFIDGLTAKWNNSNVSITGIASYQFISDNMTLDNDFLPVSYFAITQKKDEHAVTGEIIAKNNKPSKVNWIAGVFGYYRNNNTTAPVTLKEYGIENLIEHGWNQFNPEYPLKWDTNSFLLGSEFKLPNYNISAYTELSKEIAGFTFIGGVRFDYEVAKLNYASDCSTSYTIYKDRVSPDNVYKQDKVEIHSRGDLKRSFTELSPKLSIIYTLPSHKNINFYASVSRGFKAGGFNTQMFSDVLQQELMGYMGIGKKYEINDVVGYKPEKSWNYEVGGKFNFFDGRLSTDFAAFYIDCRDQQLTIFPDGTTTGRIMANAGKTRSTGIEFSVTSTPVNRLLLRAGYGYTNAKFLEFNNGKKDYSGKFLPYAPQNTIFASASYSFKIGKEFLRYITVTGETNGAGKIYWNESNEDAQKFYALLNASVKATGKNYNLTLWAKNITGTQYSTFYFVSIQHKFLQRGKPFQFGATLRINI